MLKRNLIVIAIISLALFFTTNVFGQNSKRKRTKARVATPTTTTTPPTNARKSVDHLIFSVEEAMEIKSPKPTGSNLMKGHEGMQEREAGSGNAMGRKGTGKAVDFSSTTQPHADGVVSNTGKNTTLRKRPIKPVRNLELDNGGMDTVDEQPEFGDPALRQKKPQGRFSIPEVDDEVLVKSKNKPEANPALLEFQIPEKIVTDNKHPETVNARTSAPKSPKPIIILDNDGETEVSRNRKPLRNLSTTAVEGDGQALGKTSRKRKTTSRKKPKTQNLLPYMEQDNIYRKRKRNK